MEYRIVPVGDMWQNGSFCIPTRIVTDYIRLASEYQIKALLIVLSTGGSADSKTVARTIGCTEEDACEFLDFWAEEGMLIRDGEMPTAQPVAPKTAEKKETKKSPAVEALPVPTLSSKDIVDMCRENDTLADLLRNAEEVLGKMLSHIERQLITNMLCYYGLPADVVLVILQYYKTERSHGRAIGNAYISAMAKEWAESGITTLEAADERLHELEAGDRLWREIVAMSGIRHRSPTQKQREMIKQWNSDFSIEMISLACDAMKENAQKPNLKYVDSVLKNWKKNGINTPEDVARDNERHNSEKAAPKERIDTTYDIDSIEKRAMFNDDYDV